MSARRRSWLLAAILLAAPAFAEITPQGGPGDPHIQTVRYDPQEVVALHVASGFAVTVQFSPEERIETVTVGESSAWAVQVDHAADHLVVKPLGAPPPTNLTVITDQHSYNFTLYSGTAGEGVQPYTVAFTYPAPETQPVSPVAVIAGRYRLHGDRALWPVAIGDDGAATTIRWGADTLLPAVYRTDRRGHMALVNGLMQGGAYVIEGVYPSLIFVSGRSRASASHIDGTSR